MVLMEKEAMADIELMVVDMDIKDPNSYLR